MVLLEMSIWLSVEVASLSKSDGSEGEKILCCEAPNNLGRDQ
jgi:hypothetical protein